MPRLLSKIAASTLVGLCCWLGQSSTLLGQSSRPNIILVMTDDQGYGDVAVHGNPAIHTPHLDQLARESRRFTDFLVSPTCAPTRSALMTGRHEFKNGVTHTINERERLSLSAITLPQVLKQAGYVSGIFGKWHLGDEDPYQPGRRGFDEVCIHGAGGIGQSYPGSCGDAPGNSYYGPVLRHNGRFIKTDGYCTTEFFDRALTWMDSVRGKQPFFCYITPNVPHDPLNPPEGYLERYAGQVPENVARFYAMVTHFDEQMGRMLARLKEWNLDDQTLVIFMTDNGSANGAGVFNDGMRGKKGTPFRGGIRVPSFWRWPGKIAPGPSSVMGCHYDILPTLMDLTAIPADEVLQRQIEGRSLRPWLENPRHPGDERFHFTHLGRWATTIDPRQTPDLVKYHQCSVRWKNWTLVSPGKPTGAPPWELHDLQTDPGESKNVAAQHPEVVAAMKQAYDDWWVSVLPHLENEGVVGPAENPFHTAYWEQYRGPGPNRVSPPRPIP